MTDFMKQRTNFVTEVIEIKEGMLTFLDSEGRRGNLNLKEVEKLIGKAPKAGSKWRFFWEGDGGGGSEIIKIGAV